MTAEETVQFFKTGMNLGWSGFTPAGYPKVVPIAVAEHVEKNNLQGKWKFNLFIGASVGAETEDRWATLDMIDRRWPYQTGKNIAAGINEGRIRMGDKHLSLFAQDLGYGFYTKDSPTGKLDLAIIEVSAITEDGSLVPTSSCGVIPEILMMCDNIIIEVNTGQPSFEGIHDLISPGTPPNRQVFNITKAGSRIGSTSIPCDPNKIIAVVESKLRDQGRAFAEQDDTSEAIANHVIDFLTNEVKAGRLPKNLLPLQSGVGSIANAVIGGLAKGPLASPPMTALAMEPTPDCSGNRFLGRRPALTSWVKNSMTWLAIASEVSSCSAKARPWSRSLDSTTATIFFGSQGIEVEPMRVPADVMPKT
jgi:acetyl-CoA hydrolase